MKSATGLCVYICISAVIDAWIDTYTLPQKYLDSDTSFVSLAVSENMFRMRHRALEPKQTTYSMKHGGGQCDSMGKHAASGPGPLVDWWWAWSRQMASEMFRGSNFCPGSWTLAQNTHKATQQFLKAKKWNNLNMPGFAQWLHFIFCPMADSITTNLDSIKLI